MKNRVIIPARQAIHRLAEEIPRNRLLGSLNVYKFGLWTVANQLLGSLNVYKFGLWTVTNRLLGSLNVYKFGLWTVATFSLAFIPV